MERPVRPSLVPEPHGYLMERTGIEPVTSGLQSRADRNGRSRLVPRKATQTRMVAGFPRRSRFEGRMIAEGGFWTYKALVRRGTRPLRCCETVPMGEDRERPPDSGEPSGEGAPSGDPEYHLHTELAEETKRLATHPREEAHRLAEELREGETETTPLIALSGLALGLGVVLAILIALALLIARLV
jgi:hypothetical protein